ncbi:SDR family oxidoreductase [Vibrio gazogenes]|uniref:Short-chain dehydrogenase n=1 Tax=Vibrio gazogenes DSM 21264 = NBRC 103151 TaxID=1123492 RepID=A0A1M5DJV9_VIBGA|nr:SDR family oxidoreductase [Vibrio gazogenes]USP14602.1 SDR family oxidoreductase [Vibrio gazogenes]SHF67185.1 Short-chain dehydrogenase [Vibrio gazogenes DSM 21264] [Vibrio gazogenes DSM 21264 = NBRC 103151]
MSKTILITGCSSGIGYVTAHALHKKGYQVIASCRDIADVQRLQNEGLTAIHLDVTNPTTVDAAIKEVMTLTNHRLDALFNNGAYGQPGALEDLPTQAMREQFETNFFGWHDLTTKLLPQFRRQGHGRIIQNSSVLGFAAMKYRGAYNASKFAIEGWSDTLRLELKQTDIHISILEPGPIETQFRENALAAFLRWVTPQNSIHAQAYQQQIERLSQKKSNNRFSLPPEDCLPAIFHALESPTPRIRYRITKPTQVFAVLKRLLPTRWLDGILNKAA